MAIRQYRYIVRQPDKTEYRRIMSEHNFRTDEVFRGKHRFVWKLWASRAEIGDQLSYNVGEATCSYTRVE